VLKLDERAKGWGVKADDGPAEANADLGCEGTAPKADWGGFANAEGVGADPNTEVGPEEGAPNTDWGVVVAGGWG